VRNLIQEVDYEYLILEVRIVGNIMGYSGKISRAK
jgi:hypothetical protein